MEVEGEGDYIPIATHHQNDSCIKMGSNESHFNVSLIVRDKVARQCLQATTFEEKGEPKRIRTEVLLLGLTARPNRLTLLSTEQVPSYRHWATVQMTVYSTNAPARQT